MSRSLKSKLIYIRQIHLSTYSADYIHIPTLMCRFFFSKMYYFKSRLSCIAYLPHVIEIDSLYVQSELPHPLKWHAAISVSVPKHCKSSIETGTLLEKLPKGESLFIIGCLKILYIYLTSIDWVMFGKHRVVRIISCLAKKLIQRQQRQYQTTNVNGHVFACYVYDFASFYDISFKF